MRAKKPTRAAAAKSFSGESGAQVPGENAMGEVRIHENVIAALVRRAALTVDGVSRLAGSPLVDNIAEIVGSRRMQSRAITTEMGDNRVAIEVKINVLFDYNVPQVAQKVQSAVISEVEKVTGMTVTKVNVVVQEIDLPEDEDDDDDDSGLDGTVPMS